MTERLFPGPGDMRARLRAFDWSQTPLGPLETWPRSLVGYVEMILDMPTPAIIFWGPDQTQIYNDGYAVIMGPRHPKYFGAPYRECWPDTYPTIYPLMRRVLAGGFTRVDRTLFTLTRHGFVEEAYFTFTFSPLRDDTGAIAGIFQPVVEVTDAVLAGRRAETLRLLAQKPDSLDAATRDAMVAFAVNAEDIPFAFIYLWDPLRRRIELAARSLPHDEPASAALAQAARECLEAGAPRLLDDVEQRLGRAPIGPWGDPTRSAFLVPLRPSTPDAARGVVVFGVSPRLHFDDNYRGFLELAAAQMADSRERALLVEREAAARREAELQKEHLASLFMQAPTPICVLRGPDHVVELANAEMLGFWGMTPGEVLHRPLFDAVPALREQVFKDLLDGVLRSGVAYVGKEVAAKLQHRKDGTLGDVHFNFVYQPLTGVSGRPEGVLVLAFDVTDEVRAREQMLATRDAAERASRSKDEFLAMLGHELRNPLAPLQMSLHLVRRRLPPSLVDRQLDIVERQANNLARIVNDLLEVSRVTQGKIELRKERVDLARLVTAAIDSTREQIDARRHALSVAVPGPIFLFADPVRIEQVIVNLLTNAAKYTDPGGRIRVTAERVGDRVALRIRDDGIGFGDDLRPHLFELFQQGSREASRTQGGLGIGLTIVRRLVELHDGRVEAHSEGPGEGSEFVVTLPLAAEQPPAEASTKPATPATDGARAPRRVLIVDDNLDAADVLATAIEDLGHTTRTAPDGPSALDICDQWRPELVFLDIGLPGMDGYAVAREIQRRRSDRPVLVALTGYGQESDRQRARDAGFDRHLVKPAPLDAIESVFETLGR